MSFLDWCWIFFSVLGINLYVPTYYCFLQEIQWVVPTVWGWILGLFQRMNFWIFISCNELLWSLFYDRIMILQNSENSSKIGIQRNMMLKNIFFASLHDIVYNEIVLNFELSCRFCKGMFTYIRPMSTLPETDSQYKLFFSSFASF